MLNFFFGAVIVAAVLLVVDYVRRNQLAIPWWGWLLSILALAYTVFVIAGIGTMILEDDFLAAQVFGLILGLPAVIWIVLLGRYVFSRRVGQA